MCLNCKSESGCKYGDKCRFRHVEADGQPSKKSKKRGVKGSVSLLKRSTYNWVVYLKILIRENLFHVNQENWDRNTPSNTWHQIKIRERKGPSRGIIQKCAPHERSPCAPQFEEISHEETLHQERSARKGALDLAKNIFKLETSDKTMFYFLGEVEAMPAPTSKRPEEQDLVVDSGASMHMMSKKN